MLFTLAFYFSFYGSLRSSILLFTTLSKSRFCYAIFCLLYGALALLLFPSSTLFYNSPSFYLLHLCGILWLWGSCSKKNRSFHPLFHLFSITALLLLASLSCLQLQQRPVLQVTIPGHRIYTTTEWKLPSSSLKKAELATYEVDIHFIQSNTRIQSFLLGDLLAVRFRVLHLQPWLHWLGVYDPYWIDSISSDYLNPSQRLHLPTESIPIPKYTSFPRWLSHAAWKLWESIFYDTFHLFFIENAALQTEHFPLVDSTGKPLKKIYLLWQTSQGTLISESLSNCKQENSKIFRFDR